MPRRPGTAKLWRFVAPVLSGTALALAYSQWEWSALAWFWLVPLLHLLWFDEVPPGRPRWRRGFLLGYLGGISFFVVNLSWLFELRHTVDHTLAGLVSWWGLSAYLAVYFGLWGAFAATIGRWQPAPRDSGWLGPSLETLRAAFLCGAAWCGLEWVRGWMLSGFGWNGLGVALHKELALIQIADVVGVTGLSFLLVFCNAVLLATLVRLVSEVRDRRRIRPHLDFGFAMLLVIGVFLYGVGKLTAPLGDSKEVRALIVQLGIPIDEKWDPEFTQRTLRDYEQLTSAYVESSAYDLVIWPETALPGRFFHPGIQRFLNHVLASGDEAFTLVTGIEEDDPLGGQSSDGREIAYNTIAAMRGSTEDHQIYRKVHLVPFGEFLPFRPVLGKVAGGWVPGDFERGTSREPLMLEASDVQLIPLICFEDTIGRHARKFVREGRPQLMVNVTNDGWFWESAASAQHLANARFRCIELRRPMARAANTGVSGFIDEVGSTFDRRVQPAPGEDPFPRLIQDESSGRTFIRGTLPATVHLDPIGPLTFYARYGDAFSVLLGSLSLGLAIGHAVLRRTRRPRQSGATAPGHGDELGHSGTAGSTAVGEGE